MFDAEPYDTRRIRRSATKPGHIYHDAFADRSAPREFDPAVLLEARDEFDDNYMPDDVTRDHSRRMHYAAYRLHRARTPADDARWRQSYIGLRDRIVLGNRKLIYRAVRRRMAFRDLADDLIGDCQIVLIGAVAAFNPWMGIRFSTYAFTCLVRALSRASLKQSADRLSHSLPLYTLPDDEPRGRSVVRDGDSSSIPIEVFLREDHPLLTDREKQILARRFNFLDDPVSPTLESVGLAVGLSKERVRQLQASAILKLRGALLSGNSTGGVEAAPAVAPNIR